MSESLPNPGPYSWQGRLDEDAVDPRRLFQFVTELTDADDCNDKPVLLGLETDEGVRRNQGRTGAADGPNALRQSLSGLCLSSRARVFDAGNFTCVEGDLEDFQDRASNRIEELLRRRGLPLVLGGGHEIGWPSFLGAQRYLQSTQPGARLGILNVDAHFDLRPVVSLPHSGTGFWQAAQWCKRHNLPFDYKLIGIARPANSAALFQFARAHDVQWIEDRDCLESQESDLKQKLTGWIHRWDALYLSCDLDVFPGDTACGVSAPASLGVAPNLLMRLVQHVLLELKRQGKPLLVADVAELNPALDGTGQTARLGARYLYEILLTWWPEMSPDT